MTETHRPRLTVDALTDLLRRELAAHAGPAAEPFALVFLRAFRRGFFGQQGSAPTPGGLGAVYRRPAQPPQQHLEVRDDVAHALRAPALQEERRVIGTQHGDAAVTVELPAQPTDVESRA